MLAACGSANPTPSGAPRVAIVLGGRANDAGFNEIGADAVLKLQREHVIDAQVRESVTNPADAEPILRQYAAEGYDLVIGWGVGFSDAVFRVGAQFPKTRFIASGGVDVLARATANVETWTYDAEQLGYLLGFIAGATKLSPVAVVDGEQQPFVEAQWFGFDQGLHAANPDAKALKPVYTGSFDDPQKAEQATAAQIAAGAKLIATEPEASSPGVASAARNAGVATVGMAPNSSDAARAVNVGRVDTDMTQILRDWVDRLRKGTFGGRGTTSTITNHSIVPADITKVAAAPDLPADLTQRVDALAKDLASGKVTIVPWKPGQ
ncbi:basic membrane protein A [Kutzneria buriramensis]|uniref:Basic membrane protein A n=2 Tax=Kutzneria buriramensis TaxID=1045776 RepID=A0A3E0HDM6_9PSEU|nr:basic membrane protein A [Kutzneria buriramensis]